MCPNAVNTIFVYYSGRTVNSQTSALEMLVWCCWCWRLLLLPFLCKLLLLVLFRLLVFYSPFLCSPSHAHSLCPSFVAVISLCAPNKRYICTCASHLLLCIALYVLCVNKASFIVVADTYIYVLWIRFVSSAYGGWLNMYLYVPEGTKWIKRINNFQQQSKRFVGVITMWQH